MFPKKLHLIKLAFLLFSLISVSVSAQSQNDSGDLKFDIEDFIYEHFDYPRSLKVVIPSDQVETFFHQNKELEAILTSQQYLEKNELGRPQFSFHNKNVLHENYDLNYRVTGVTIKFGTVGIILKEFTMTGDQITAKVSETFSPSDTNFIDAVKTQQTLLKNLALDLETRAFSVKIDEELSRIILD